MKETEHKKDSGSLCSKCREPAIIEQHYSGNALCHSHFIADVEAKAKRVIRTHNWLSSNDSIAVALSGGEASAAVFFFLHKLTKHRRDIRLSAIHIDEGIANFQRKEDAISIAEKAGVPCIISSFADAYGKTVDQYATQEEDVCVWCERKRHQLLDQIAQEQGFTKIAYGYHLEDISTAVLTHIIQGDPSFLLDGDTCNDETHIAPFRLIPKKEVILYSGMRSFARCPYAKQDVKGEIEEILGNYTKKHPSVHHAIVSLSDKINIYKKI